MEIRTPTHENCFIIPLLMRLSPFFEPLVGFEPTMSFVPTYKVGALDLYAKVAYL